MSWLATPTGKVSASKKCKRGFQTRREAQEWEHTFQMQTSSDMDMSFEAFAELYARDIKPRLKETTWLTKEHIIRTKLLPYFGRRKIAEILPKDILAWQNEMLNSRDKNGCPYSPVYLKTVHTQLSTIFNHACKFYGLRENPAMKVGTWGRRRTARC